MKLSITVPAFNEERTIRHGIANATGDLILNQDADLEYDPQDHLALLPRLCDRRAKVVYGSRLPGYEKQFGKGTVRRHPGAYRSAYLGGGVVTEFTNLLYGSHLTSTSRRCAESTTPSLRSRRTSSFRSRTMCWWATNGAAA